MSIMFGINWGSLEYKRANRLAKHVGAGLSHSGGRAESMKCSIRTFIKLVRVKKLVSVENAPCPQLRRDENYPHMLMVLNGC